MTEDEELIPHTAVAFAPGEVTPDTSDYTVHKVCNELQWLVCSEKSFGSFCWVYYSKIQQRFKCRSNHPNAPGTAHKQAYECYPCFILSAQTPCKLCTQVDGRKHERLDPAIKAHPCIRDSESSISIKSENHSVCDSQPCARATGW